ncbi:MAG: hypothetical protein YHS30scaffold667_45 [Phage 65_10]|nr:MAG: hypothetical protein YHS30scaffold667_45 [Phage 65_10]
MRALVCGGRTFSDAAALDRALGLLPITLLIHGGAPGADRLAGDWAHAHGVPYRVYFAEWNKHGRSAGGLRNTRMLVEGKPDVVVAFPGGYGTANMVRQARAAGVPVITP